MKPEVYAKAMHTLSAQGVSAAEIVAGATASLKARGMLRLLPQVLSSFKRLAVRASSKGAVLTVAREADVAAFKGVAAIDAETAVKVDESIIGGYRLESKGKLIDNSFKTHLLEAYRNATRA